MTQAKLYFDAPTLALAMLAHGDESAIASLSTMAAHDGFSPDDMLGHAPAFTLLRDAVRAWCAANNMKPGPWTHDAPLAREAVLWLGQYLAGIVDDPPYNAAKLATWWQSNRDREDMKEARRFFDRQAERMTIFDYDRAVAQSCKLCRVALRQVAYAMTDGDLASICPAIRHEAAGLILDRLEHENNFTQA